MSHLTRGTRDTWDFPLFTLLYSPVLGKPLRSRREDGELSDYSTPKIKDLFHNRRTGGIVDERGQVLSNCFR